MCVFNLVPEYIDAFIRGSQNARVLVTEAGASASEERRAAAPAAEGTPYQDTYTDRHYDGPDPHTDGHDDTHTDTLHPV